MENPLDLLPLLVEDADLLSVAVIPHEREQLAVLGKRVELPISTVNEKPVVDEDSPGWNPTSCCPDV